MFPLSSTDCRFYTPLSLVLLRNSLCICPLCILLLLGVFLLLAPVLSVGSVSAPLFARLFGLLFTEPCGMLERSLIVGVRLRFLFENSASSASRPSCDLPLLLYDISLPLWVWIRDMFVHLFASFAERN